MIVIVILILKMMMLMLMMSLPEKLETNFDIFTSFEGISSLQAPVQITPTMLRK